MSMGAIAPISMPSAPPAQIQRGQTARPPGIVPPVVDGFSYNTMPPVPLRSFFADLARLSTLRRATGYRPRWFVVPANQTPGGVVAPYDTMDEQISPTVGSYLWGYQFASLLTLTASTSAGFPFVINDSTNPPTFPADILIHAVDAGTTIPLFETFISGQAAHGDFTSRCTPVLISPPRLILDPGLVTVRISNRTANQIYCQLVLYAAEPMQGEGGGA